MKGKASLRTLSDELFPVIPFFNGVENRYLESWERFSFQFNVSAVAAQTSTAQIRNPTGSNIIAVVEKCSVVNFAGATDQPQINVQTQATDFSSIGTTTQLDSRTRTHGSVVASAQAGAALTNTIAQVQVAVAGLQADFILTPDQEIAILPGQAFQCGSQIVNQALHGCFWWRERFLEESERT